MKEDYRDYRTLQQTVREFVSGELMPLEIPTELADGRLSQEERRRLHDCVRDLGVYASSLPRDVGGTAYTWPQQVVINEEIGKVTNALGWVVWAPAIVLRHASPAQIDRYVRRAAQGRLAVCYAITEEGAGSDAANMATTAKRDGEQWILNGEKWHVTSGDVADFAIVQAATDPQLGQGVSLFFVDLDTPGVERLDEPRYMHHLIDGHPWLAFRNVRIPDENLFGELGRGLELSKEWFLHERVMIAARCNGAAQRLIDEACDFALEREQFGAPIATYQAIQFMLADSVVECWGSRLMTYEVARAAEVATEEEEWKRVHARASMAKLFASEMAGRVSDRAVQIFGGRGYMRENVAERFFRELRVERIWEGTSEIQRLIISGSLYKRGVQALATVAAATGHDAGVDLDALRSRVRRFVQDELQPLEIPVEMSGGALPAHRAEHIHRRMIELQLNGMSLPEAYGGRGYSSLQQVVIQEELGQVTNGLWDTVYSPAVCLKAANAEQIERYVRPTCAGDRRDAYAITEPGAGSDASAMATTAVRQGEVWVLNGEKWHVTAGDVADYYVVQAATEHGPTLFFVDRETPGLQIIDNPAYMHTFIVAHLKVQLNDVRVPQQNVLGAIGAGLELTKEWFRRERLMIAARCVGAAQRLLAESAAFAQDRVQFGSPIANYQAIQFMLADSLTELWAARLMTYDAARAEDAVADDESLKIAHAKASMAKLYASEMAGRVADRAVQIFGGRGYMRQNVAERFFREVRVDRIWEGTSEIQRIIIAHSLYKRGLEALID